VAGASREGGCRPVSAGPGGREGDGGAGVGAGRVVHLEGAACGGGGGGRSRGQGGGGVREGELGVVRDEQAVVVGQRRARSEVDGGAAWTGEAMRGGGGRGGGGRCGVDPMRERSVEVGFGSGVPVVARGRAEIEGGDRMDEIDCGVEGRWGGRRTGEADSRESGKSRNKFLSPLRTF
jgi:hypothetical protein